MELSIYGILIEYKIILKCRLKFKQFELKTFQEIKFSHEA